MAMRTTPGRATAGRRDPARSTARPGADAGGLRWSPAWAVEAGGPGRAGDGGAGDGRGGETTIVLSAGADRRVAIDGLAPAEVAAVRGWSGTGDISVDPRTTPLVDRLVELGALVPGVGPGAPTVVGDDVAVARALRDQLAPTRPTDVVVAVRTGPDWPPVPAGVHLGVDLSLHHTLVLGPLVAPGVSACLGCLDARAARRWGVPTVPARPAAQRHLALAASLVEIQLDLVAAGASPLVNATIAWNLESGTSDRQALYKLPGCPRCAAAPVGPPPAEEGAGRVSLPWALAEPPVGPGHVAPGGDGRGAARRAATR